MTGVLPVAMAVQAGATPSSLRLYSRRHALPSLTGEGRVDMGNLYRVLRALEEDGLVASEWQAEAPGPAKRTYELTNAGRRLLDEWATALGRSREQIDLFLERYREGR